MDNATFILKELWNLFAPYLVPALIALVAFVRRIQLAKIVANIKYEYDCNLEGLKTKNKKGEQIHDTQFKYEFETYKELWKTICNWRREYRFYCQAIPGKKLSGDDKAYDTIQEACNKFRYFYELLEEYRPFLSSDILNEFDSIMSKYDRELYSRLISDTRKDYCTEWFEARRKTLKELDDMIFDQLLKAIKNRIGL
jgi:hypothetical protein